ncbi:MAG: response regulator, partial [bacterium]|nr:response regulator [bacterium]
KIFLVEDDQFLGGLMSNKLEKEGFSVVRVLDGEEAVKKIFEDRPDLVLLDIILPGMDGFEVLKRLREDPQTAKIPVIMLTNLGAKEDIERGFKLGAQDYMVKAHFTPGEIVAKIKSVLGIVSLSPSSESPIIYPIR